MNTSIRQPWIISSVLVTVLAAAGPAALAQKRPTLDQRVTLIEHKLDNAALGEMANQMESLQQQVQNLRGDLEQMQHQLQDLQDRQRNIYSDIDSRLRVLEQGASKTTADTGQQHAAVSDRTPPATGGKAAEGSQGTAPGSSGGSNQASSGSGKPEANSQQSGKVESTATGSADSTTDRASEYQAYERAFSTLKDGRYAKAQQEFSKFLQDYPNGQYADNARYWLGESYYVGRQFNQALEQFQKVVDDFPNSGKRPGAALKIGYIQYEQGHFDQARKTLGDVIQRYPNSTAAILAQQRLRLIDSQKH